MFFQPGDTEDLASAMLEVIRNVSLWQELSRRGLEFAGIYDWENNQHKYLGIVDSLAASAPSKTTTTA